MKISARLKEMLAKGISGNQSQLVQLLEGQGVKTTQSTVSRALKKINAVKSVDEYGNTVYTLPISENGINKNGFFHSLVYRIMKNQNLVVVHTKPGTANAVAKLIDDHGFEGILGSVAGDDTIMIAPSDVNRTAQVAQTIEDYLKGIGIY